MNQIFIQEVSALSLAFSHKKTVDPCNQNTIPSLRRGPLDNPGHAALTTHLLAVLIRIREGFLVDFFFQVSVAQFQIGDVSDEDEKNQ